MASKGASQMLYPPVQDAKRFAELVSYIAQQQIDPELTTDFVNTVLAAESDGRPFIEEVDDVRLQFRVDDRAYYEPWRTRRIAVVARLRALLADACITALEPDLVILDEFQRFPRLLQPDNPTGELARKLFDYEGCKTLLLSATPYKMLTRAHELDEDHHEDFKVTTGFLMDNEKRSEQLAAAMGSYRSALREAAHGGDFSAVRRARNAVQRQLSTVMCRTERLGVSGDRDGMLNSKPANPVSSELRQGDLKGFAELDSVARAIGSRDVVEYWKSTPYALNMMDNYEFSRVYKDTARSLKLPPIHHGLDIDAMSAYGKIDPGNARLRGLWSDLDRRNAWKQLWIAPSLPYYQAGAPFNSANLPTKRLIFSAWAVVPKTIASLTSYHAERQIFAAHNRKSPIENSTAGRKSIGQPFTWKAKGAMTEALLVLPSRRLAELADPIALAAEAGAADGSAPLPELLQLAEGHVAEALAELELPAGGGRVDPFWYVVAMLRLEEQAHPGSVKQWLNRHAIDDHDEGEDGEESGHVVWSRNAAAMINGVKNDPPGAVPKDLARVLALVGVGGPGVCALRGLQRVLPDDDSLATLSAALRLGNSMRLMLNLPESVALVSRFGGSGVYSRKALRYCANGNLQAVFDEYFHVLNDWVGADENRSKLNPIQQAASEALGVNAVPLSAHRLPGKDGKASEDFPMRSRFALRLGTGGGEDEKSVQRVDSVRKAFNSPFWPFVLASTSVGQEGLDFHLYCHAVVHWNLPHNPVDLEQREGRVHRFKNHAVRRNLAEQQRDAGVGAVGVDPWTAMFNAVPETSGGLEPYWVLPGSAAIERHVPCEPLGADSQRLEELVRLMGIYRLAFGQPRQDEFLAALRASPAVVEAAGDLMIDLRPRRELSG